MDQPPQYSHAFDAALFPRDNPPRVLDYTKNQWKVMLEGAESISMALPDLLVTLVYFVDGEGSALDMVGMRDDCYEFGTDAVDLFDVKPEHVDRASTFNPVYLVRDGNGARLEIDLRAATEVGNLYNARRSDIEISFDICPSDRSWSQSNARMTWISVKVGEILPVVKRCIVQKIVEAM